MRVAPLSAFAASRLSAPKTRPDLQSISSTSQSAAAPAVLQDPERSHSGNRNFPKRRRIVKNDEISRKEVGSEAQGTTLHLENTFSRSQDDSLISNDDTDMFSETQADVQSG